MNTKKRLLSTSTVFIGIDNGPSGSIGILEYNERGMRTNVYFCETPTYMVQDYTKAKKRISQLDIRKVRTLFKKYRDGWKVHIAMERPLVNPTRFTATVVGCRVHQSYLDILTWLKLPYPVFTDSKAWQKMFLPKGTVGTDLKVRSKEFGIRAYPEFTDVFRKHKDADGIFIAEWLKKQVML